MSNINVIIYISVFIWILPAIRQLKGNYSFYFIILALADPLNLVAVMYIRLPPNILHAIAAVGLFYSVGISKEDLQKHWIFHLIILVMFIFLLYSMTNLLLLICFFHGLVLFKFFKILIKSSFETEKLNIFQLVLVFYELSIVITFFVLISGSTQSIILYYSTLSFDFLVALFFTIYKEESANLLIALKSSA
jgi:hypothetical protein